MDGGKVVLNTVLGWGTKIRTLTEGRTGHCRVSRRCNCLHREGDIEPDT